MTNEVLLDSYYKRLYPEGLLPHIRYWFSIRRGLKEYVWVLACSECNGLEYSPKTSAANPSELVWLSHRFFFLYLQLMELKVKSYLHTQLLRLYAGLRGKRQ